MIKRYKYRTAFSNQRIVTFGSLEAFDAPDNVDAVSPEGIRVYALSTNRANLLQPASSIRSHTAVPVAFVL